MHSRSLRTRWDGFRLKVHADRDGREDGVWVPQVTANDEEFDEQHCEVADYIGRQATCSSLELDP